MFDAACKVEIWSGAAAAYWVWAEVMVVLAEAANPLDRQHSAGNNEVMVRDSQGSSPAPLLCCLVPLPAVLAADVRPHPEVVWVHVPAAGPHGAAGHIVACTQAGALSKSWTAGCQPCASLLRTPLPILLACVQGPASTTIISPV